MRCASGRPSSVLQKDRHVLYRRGRSGGYCLWSHTSVNIEAAYDEAGRAVGAPQRVTTRVLDYSTRDRSSLERTTLRPGISDSSKSGIARWQEREKAAAEPLVNSDGRIVIPLSETEEEARLATDFARSIHWQSGVLIGITQPLGSSAGLLQEVELMGLGSKAHSGKLKEDRYAAEEVARQLTVATQALRQRIQHFAGLRQTTASGKLSIRWFDRTRFRFLLQRPAGSYLGTV